VVVVVGVKPQCPTAQDALKQALVAVLSYSGPGHVTDVTFGRYADLESGWYWHADVTRRLAMPGSKLDQEDDTLERKILKVVERWVLDTARYEQDFTPQEPS
jgi:hypothetical protein